MPYYMYVSLQDDDKILIFSMDAETGKLTPRGELPLSGGLRSTWVGPVMAPGKYFEQATFDSWRM